MTRAPRIGLLGFGEVGQILGEDLKSDHHPILAYDLKFSEQDSAPSKALAENESVSHCFDPVEFGQTCGLIISAVTAANTQTAAKSVVKNLGPNSWFLDLNSASPQTKLAAADLINSAGGRYIEASVMSPVPPKRLATPILIGGPHASAFLEIGAEIGFKDLSVFSDVYGKAAAAKMCRSVMIKGIEALLSESLIAARAYGVEDTVLRSIEDLLPGPDWPALAKYMIERTLLHGGRRAEEMREVADTVAATGLEASMSRATVRRQDWAKAYPNFQNIPTLDEMLDALVKAASPETRGKAL